MKLKLHVSLSSAEIRTSVVAYKFVNTGMEGLINSCLDRLGIEPVSFKYEEAGTAPEVSVSGSGWRIHLFFAQPRNIPTVEMRSTLFPPGSGKDVSFIYEGEKGGHGYEFPKLTQHEKIALINMVANMRTMKRVDGYSGMRTV